MTANQARTQSDESLKVVNNKLYKQIIKDIDNQSKTGNDFIYLYENISEDIKKVLIRDGFKIKDTSDPYRNEIMWRIDW